MGRRREDLSLFELLKDEGRSGDHDAREGQTEGSKESRILGIQKRCQRGERDEQSFSMIVPRRPHRAAGFHRFTLEFHPRLAVPSREFRHLEFPSFPRSLRSEFP